MNKLVFYIILLYIIPVISVQAQNLVPNPSFENIMVCPTNMEQIYFAEPWFMNTPCTWDLQDFHSCSSAELFHECSTLSSQVGVPINIFGYQQPRTGSAYAGLGIWVIMDHRERIETPLLDSLRKDSIYCVKMYVVNKRPVNSLAETFTSTSNVHILFTKDSLIDYYSNSNFIQPSIKNPNDNIISDTINWTEVSGCYKAKGGERFLTIGNFYDNANSTISDSVSTGAYYLIDDVSVTLYDGQNCSCADESDNGDNNDINNSLIPNVFTPNKDGINDNWSVLFKEEDEYVLIVNRWGNTITKLDIHYPVWDGTSNGIPCIEGVYFYRAYLRKMFKSGFIQLMR